MPIVYEDKNKKDGLHIFLIGLSEYSNGFFNLSTVDVCALSVYHLYQTFYKHRDALEIASIWLLIAPSDDEKKDSDFSTWLEKTSKHKDIQANAVTFMTEIQEFYNLELSQNSKTLFYCAGHGIQRPILEGDDILILNDCPLDDNYVNHVFQLKELKNKGIFCSQANQHLFFFDICRTRPNLETLTLNEKDSFKKKQTVKIYTELANPNTKLKEVFELKEKYDSSYLQQFFECSAAFPGQPNKSQTLNPTPLALALKAAFCGGAATPDRTDEHEYAQDKNIFQNKTSNEWFITCSSLEVSIKRHFTTTINRLKKAAPRSMANITIVKPYIIIANGFDLVTWTGPLPECLVEITANFPSMTVLKFQVYAKGSIPQNCILSNVNRDYNDTYTSNLSLKPGEYTVDAEVKVHLTSLNRKSLYDKDSFTLHPYKILPGKFYFKFEYNFTYS